jgi:5-(carboxyamino)imidazole ribonucleotide synthase
MKQNNFYNKKLGILGGGQLGKMLCIPAANWHLKTLILDPTIDCPASIVCNNIHVGNFTDYDTVYKFGQLVDIITIEIENVNVDALIKLKQEGKTVHPDPFALRIIQDKGLQKEFYAQNKLSSPPYILCENKNEVIEQIESGKITFPFVQKLRTAGYDGKGVSVINTAKDTHKLMDAPCVIEQKVNIKKELSVIAARDVDGNVKCFTSTEMVFDDEANLVTLLICPAQISESIAQKAEALAMETIKAFGIVGLLAVELFLDVNDELLINEVAPRPHNSGHHTIENAITSQYEQQLRAVMGLPLGSTQTILPAVMINLLGEPGYSGPVKYQGIEQCMAIEGAKFHIYGKAETKPFRKMGHITIIDQSIENAQKKAEQIQKTLKVIS